MEKYKDSVAEYYTSVYLLRGRVDNIRYPHHRRVCRQAARAPSFCWGEPESYCEYEVFIFVTCVLREHMGCCPSHLLRTLVL